MFKNRILKKLGAGLMAGLCAFTLIGTNLSSFKTSAAETAKEPLLSGDEVIKQAAKYLGVPTAGTARVTMEFIHLQILPNSLWKLYAKGVLTAPV